jgi:hypothetical protein
MEDNPVSEPMKAFSRNTGRPAMHGDIKEAVNGGSVSKRPTPHNIGEIINMQPSKGKGGAKIEKLGVVMGQK